nr:MAG TPA: Phycobilisome 32.1 kDa linker polypeptide [Caudoviricetes sp.]
MWYSSICDIRATGSEPSQPRRGTDMPFVAGKDQRAERARYREDELVVERAKYAAELLRKRIRREGVIQAQYPQVFGFKAQQTIHNHFRSGKVTLIDLIRIVGTPGFDISIDDVLRTAISIIQSTADVEPDEEPAPRPRRRRKPKKDQEAKLTTEKAPARPALKGTEVDEELFLSKDYSRFANLFKQASGEEDD